MKPDRLIVHQFDPGREVPGGINTCISDIVRYAPEGYSIAIAGVSDLAGDRLGEWTVRTLQGREIQFMPLARLSPERQDRRVPHSVRVAAGLARFRRRMPRVLTQTHRVDLGAAAQSLLPRRETIQFVHTDTEKALESGTDSLWRLAPRVYGLVEQASLSKARRVIAFSQRDAERLRRAGFPATSMRTWFDPDLFYPAGEQGTNGVFRLAWVGRLEPPKEPELAVETIAALRDRGVDARLTVVGDGTLRPALERLVAERGVDDLVALVGKQPRRDTAEILRASRVLVMSSRFEGSPRALIESLACGVPVACTAESDPDGLVCAGKTGAIAAERSPWALADAIVVATEASSASCVDAVSALRAPDAVARLLAA
jgi:glycosyltransferase involved in cell wall biosynthesis